MYFFIIIIFFFFFSVSWIDPVSLIAPASLLTTNVYVYGFTWDFFFFQVHVKYRNSGTTVN